MRNDPFLTEEETWTEAEFFSDEEVDASSPTGAGWQTFPVGNHVGQSSGHSKTNSFELVSGRPKSSSSSVRSESSSLWREPAPPYTLSDLKITFESEDGQQLWVEPASLFVEDSPLIYNLVRQDIGAEVFNPDPISKLPNLKRHPHRQPKKGLNERLKYRLVGVTPFDFESLLVGLKPKLGQEISYERLCPLLVLATDWGFHSIRTYAINTLSKQDDLPVPRILLARRARVPEWLPEAYLTLTTRLPLLSKYEASVLGPESTLCISDARSKIRDRRLSLIEGPRPNMLMGKWFVLHPGCWVTLCAAWRSVLTDKKYHQNSPGSARISGPVQAMFDALRDQRPLCRSCQPKTAIATFLNISSDDLLAKTYFKTRLGVELERWSATSSET
ncbi:hypothetical protein FRC04_000828 [Tulasnella sp. 424]|nr:hypothetical protein FRC04_000828 [Tulasnella sp. 424]KAG8969424.1 hypothetical protein FRC05_001059 [Tulasnella sp. 425]